ncbi:hypothetical protein IAT38_006722 [Cryptococcus sp. DSM 104549]
MAGNAEPTHRYLAWGNNVCGSINLEISSGVIEAPTEIELPGCVEIIWHGWSCTIARNDHGSLLVWGTDPLASDESLRSSFSFDSDAPVRVVGFDHPVGFLHKGDLLTTSGKKTSSKWDDVVLTGIETVYAFRTNDGVYRFESLDDLLSDDASFGPIPHPYLAPSTSLTLYATESRAFILTRGATPHLIELVDARSLPPALRSRTTAPVDVRLLDDFEGLGISKVVPGFANRLAVITEAGGAYLLAPNADSELLEFADEEEDARLVGVGSDSEVVVTDSRVVVRGKSEWFCVPCKANLQTRSGK